MGHVRHVAAAAAAIAIAVALFSSASAAPAWPDLGQATIPIYDNTTDGWNVHTGTPDPTVGFVNFRPTGPGDTDRLRLTVVLQKAAPACSYNLELVLWGTTPTGGLGPDDFHHGRINRIGTMTTNGAGNGNSGAIHVDVRTLLEAVPGVVNYGHIDIEDYDQDCVERDGTNVNGNEYAATSWVTFADGSEGSMLRWLQP